MKRLLTIIALLCVIVLSATAQELKWIDATKLGIHGYTKKTDKNPYYRYDHTPYEGLNNTVVGHSKKCTGLYLAFKTNSSQIAATWENVPRRTADNMTGILQLGLDLYIKVDGEWRFAGVGRVSTSEHKYRRTRTITKDMPEGEKECLLYLPIWCEMREVLIGIDKGATIEGLPSPFRHKVIVHGSSITHGASASRAGLTYTAIMSRNLGIDFVNFGFSGECKMQPQFLEFLKTCECDAFLFDAFSNPNGQEIKERLKGFVEGLIKAHPGKPLIFLQTPIDYDPWSGIEKAERRREKHEAARHIMKELTKQHKDVYFLEVERATGKDGSVDTSHPNDLGFHRFVEAYQPKIAKILKKYGIK